MLSPRHLLASLTLALLLATLAVARPADGLIVVPDWVDFGRWPAGEVVEGSPWIINPGTTPIEVMTVATDDPALRAEVIGSRTIGPMEARALRLRLTAPPKDGMTRIVSGTVTTTDGSTVGWRCRVSAVAPDLRLPLPEVTRGTQVVATPTMVELGEAGPGATRTGTIWLINTSRDVQRVIGATPNCGCVRALDFTPFSIEPGRAARLPVAMDTRNDVGQEQVKSVTVLFETLPPAWVQIRLVIVDPRVERVYQLLQRERDPGGSSVKALLARSSPIWIGERTGPGLLRDDRGRDPAVDWERAVGTVRTLHDLRLAGAVVTGVVEETNDLLTALGADPARYPITVWFDEDGTVSGVLYGHERAAPESAAYTRFIAWLERTRPEAAAALRSWPPAPETIAPWRDWVKAYHATP